MIWIRQAKALTQTSNNYREKIKQLLSKSGQVGSYAFANMRSP